LPFFFCRSRQPFAEKPFSLPDTDRGRSLGEWLRLLNEGDQAKLVGFIQAHYGPSALRGRSPEEIAKGQLQLRSRGGIEAIAIEPSSANDLVAILRSDDVLPKFLRLSWKFDQANPTLIAASSIGPS
jgi:hypothetical protein